MNSEARTKQRKGSDRPTGIRRWVVEHGGSVLMIGGGLAAAFGAYTERELLYFAGGVPMVVGVTIEGFIRRQGIALRVTAPVLAAFFAVRGLDRLFPSQPLWLSVVDALLLVGVFVGGFIGLLYLFRRDLDEELERLLFYRAGTYAFFVTILASFAYWGLRNAHETERARELAHGARTGIPLPELSLIWVVLFGVGAWLVSMGVLWWRSH